ncbi:tetratricopeptide repeat protein [Fusicatenibacter sp.]
MDKAEYQSRLKELNSLVKKEDYEGALAVVEAVDWRRVKSLRTLGMVAEVYEANKRYPEAKKILLMAYDRSSIGKGILYRLVEVSVKMKDFDDAIDFYNEFESVAHHDNSRYLLKYKILRGQKAPLEEQISLLEEYKEREFTERWAYELANLYSKAGETQKCVDACNELILWFSEGKYVTKAMDLKMKYEPLSPSQQVKYKHRFDYKKNEEPPEDPEALEVRLAGESGIGEMAAAKETAEMPEVKPVSGGVMSQYVAGEEEKEAGSPYEAYEKTQQAEADAEQVQEYGALQQTEPIEEIPEEKAYADSTPTYLGNTIDLHAELAKSIRDVFSFRGKKQEETAEEEEPGEEPVQYEVKDLEPEHLNVNVEVAPDASTTIKTRPQPKPKEKAEPVMPKPKAEKKYEEPDLEALFQETAVNLSEEVAEEEAAEPAEQAAEPAAEAENAEQPMDPETEAKALEEAAEAQTEAEAEETAEPAAEAETEETAEPAAEAETEEAAEPQAEDKAEEIAETVESAETPSVDAAFVIPDLTPVEETRPTIDFGELQAALNEETKAAEKTSEIELPDEKEPAAEPEVETEPEAETEPETPAEPEPADPFEPAGTQPIEITPEEIEIEVPDEPKRERVSDATINMSVEKATDATVQLIRSNIPEGTVAKSIEEVLREETPEETRLRILNDTQPDKLSDEQKALFTYFAKVPGMDIQILDAMHGVYHYAGDRTSRHGNIAIMGGYGTGKTKLSEDLVRAICADLKIPATKMARLDASVLNKKDCAQIVSKLSGGFLLIERAGLMYPETIEKLSQAMDFRTDSLVLIIEDEKVSMRGLLRNYPDFAKKFETVISIPVFTNDELVTFARTYARENGYKMDEMGVLALYTQIGNNQKEGEPMTISQVKDMVDRAIAHAEKGTRKFGRRMSRKHTDTDDRVILYEKDFEF